MCYDKSIEGKSSMDRDEADWGGRFSDKSFSQDWHRHGQPFWLVSVIVKGEAAKTSPA